jgi:uncharacterized protein DUF4389
MSMTPQGPGWWEASDRKWYPPELHPDRRAAQPPPAESAPLLPGDPLPLLVSLPPRERQRRWTVLIRPLLAVPLFIVVLFIGIATSVVVVIGWFGALFTARVPDFVRRLVTVYLRLSLRLEAYLMLLTDRFPPFDTEDVPDYPVHVAVPYATRMNRAAVFFRLVLVIPVSLLASVLNFGYAVIAFFVWVATLITGWLPSPVHDASRAILRFQFRLNAYMFLLVPTQPAQLFGDATSGVTAGGGVEATPPGVGGGVAVPQAPAWSLFLGKGAKRVLVLVIVLGVPAYVASSVFRFTAQDHLQLLVQNDDLAANMNQYAASADQCRTAPDPVSCQEDVDRVFSQQLQAFVDNVRGTSAAGISQTVIVQVTADANNAQIVTAQLADAGPTLTDYQNVYSRTDAASVLAQLVSGQTQLKNALNASPFG